MKHFCNMKRLYIQKDNKHVDYTIHYSVNNYFQQNEEFNQKKTENSILCRKIYLITFILTGFAPQR